ncbi:MAG: tetratricopeptide repeat protein [Gemmataceae bacterium]
MTGTVRTARGLVRWMLLGLAALLVGGAVWWWRSTAPPEPPQIEPSGVDPEVIEAIDAARSQVVTSPRSATAWGHLGLVLRAHDFAAESNLCLAQAERLDPRDGRWPYILGLTLVLENPPAGLDYLRRAVARLSDEPGPACRLITALLEQGLLDEASEVLDRLPRNHPRVRLLRARWHAARQEWKDALALALQSSNDSRTRQAGLRLTIDCHRRLGQTQEAEKAIAALAECPPDPPWPDPLVAAVEKLRVGLLARLARVEAYEQQQRPDLALAELERLVRRYPAEPRAWLQLGRLLRAGKRLPEAEEALSQAVKHDPQLVEGWFALGLVRLERSQVPGAAEAFTTVVRLKPDHAMGHYNLGVCRLQQGDRGGAQQAWREALRCEPGHPLATRALATLDGAKKTTNQ